MLNWKTHVHPGGGLRLESAGQGIKDSLHGRRTACAGLFLLGRLLLFFGHVLWP